MSSSILHPPAHLPPSVALQLSQQAPTILESMPTSISSYSIGNIFAAAETADLWTSYENLMLCCLRTGDDQSAKLCVERLNARFGADNERVMALKGLFREATAKDQKELQDVLQEYDTILAHDPSNMPISKRRIAILRSLERTPEAISSLISFLETSPIDAEAWSELAELYVQQGLYSQAVFALEEVLLITPMAWNMHARVGEVKYVEALSLIGGNPSSGEKLLVEALRRFSRSIELCDDYLRGYYGLKVTSDYLLAITPGSTKQSKGDDETTPSPDKRTMELLSQKATGKLAEIVRRSVGGEAGWQGYDQAELITAQALLDNSTSLISR